MAHGLHGAVAQTKPALGEQGVQGQGLLPMPCCLQYKQAHSLADLVDRSQTYLMDVAATQQSI